MPFPNQHGKFCSPFAKLHIAEISEPFLLHADENAIDDENLVMSSLKLWKILQIHKMLPSEIWMLSYDPKVLNAMVGHTGISSEPTQTERMTLHLTIARGHKHWHIHCPSLDHFKVACICSEWQSIVNIQITWGLQTRKGACLCAHQSCSLTMVLSYFRHLPSIQYEAFSLLASSSLNRFCQVS